MNRVLTLASTTQQRAPQRNDAPIGWGAAIIDERGNEIPITEAMVQRACDELSRSWLFPRVSVAH